MISPYAKIARNYVQPFGMKVIYACVAFAAILTALYADRNESNPTAFIAFIALPTAMLVGVAVGHSRELIATWQSSLVPGYRRAHLVVALVFVAIALVAVPLLLNAMVRLPLLPVLAVSAMAGALISWLAFDPSIKTLFMFAIVIAALSHPLGQAFFVRLMHGEATVGALAMLGGALAILAWIGWQTSILREEMPQYQVVSSRAGSTRPLLPSEGRINAVAEKLARWGERQIALKHPIALDDSWTRSSHRRIVTSGGWIPWRLGVGWSLMILALLLVLKICVSDNLMSLETIAAIVFVVSMPSAPVISSLLWPKRWPMMSYELSLPASRRSWVRETGLAMARDHFSIWIGTLTFCIALALVASYTGKNTYGPMRMDLSGMLFGFFFFGSGQLLAFALIVWTLRLRSMLISMVVMIIAVACSLPPLVLSANRGLTDDTLYISISSTIVIAILILLDAYRRWLRTSFD